MLKQSLCKALLRITRLMDSGVSRDEAIRSTVQRLREGKVYIQKRKPRPEVV
jgi:uncharacterized protein YoaH (UPF0181 family)